MSETRRQLFAQSAYRSAADATYSSMDAPPPASCKRGRAIALAAVITAVAIVLIILGAFFLGLWKVKGAITGGDLNCDMLVPFTGQARPIPPPAPNAGTTAAPYDPALAVAMVQFVSAAYNSVCGKPLSAAAVIRTPDGATWKRVATFEGVAAPSIGGGATEEFGAAWLGTPPHRAAAPGASTDPGDAIREPAPVLVFAFRGTLSLAGWIADFDFPQQPSVVLGPTAQVHRGFENLYLTMRAAVLATARKYPTARVLIGGHSLGGAIATLAAADLGQRGLPSDAAAPPSALDGEARPVTAYTYGCPRLGDGGFVRAMESAAPDNWRVANVADAIPTLPPPGIGGNAFRHTPRLHTVLSQQKGIAANHSLNGAYYAALTRPPWPSSPTR